MYPNNRHHTFKLIALSRYVTQALALTTLLIGLMILLSHVLNWDVIYQPMGQGTPISDPSVAVNATLLAAAFWLKSRRHMRWALLLLVVPLATSLMRLIDYWNHEPQTQFFSLFSSLVSPEAMVYSDLMSLNTLSVIVFIALATLAGIRKHIYINQLLGFLAVSILIVSLIGYLYGARYFYGQMSLTTILMLLPISLSALLITANKGVLRSFLVNRPSGQIARMQLFVGYSFIFFTGLIVVYIDHHYGFAGNNLSSLITVSFGFFFTLIIVASTLYTAKIEAQQNQNARKLQNHAQYDQLTGCYNRHYFITLWNQLTLTESHANVCLMVIDLDYFKAINDRYGHLTGDQVLKTLAHTLKANARQTDLLVRFGGEEFVFVTKTDTAEGGYYLAERMRQAVAKSIIQSIPGQTLTCSIGVYCSQQKELLDEMIRKADEAMYHAKTQGRNQTVVYNNLVQEKA